MDKKTAAVIRDKLYAHFGDKGCALTHKNAYELLVATILSAQCTDVRVNKVTAELFKAADTPAEMTAMGEEKLLDIIKSCGLANSKSRNITAMSRALTENFGGEVPHTFEALTSLAGVGRKTANVVLANAFGVPAIAVDTHVFRVANRLGLAQAATPEKTEEDLKSILDKDDWSRMHHMLIWHGRETCHARKPDCESCILKSECAFYGSGKNI